MIKAGVPRERMRLTAQSVKFPTAEAMFDFINQKYFVIFENESNTTLENAQINETLINNFTDLINNETNLTSILITNLSTNVINQTNDIQLSAEINKPVKWVRILSTNKNGKSLKLRNGASNILVSNLDSGIPVDITNKISIKQNVKIEKTMIKEVKKNKVCTSIKEVKEVKKTVKKCVKKHIKKKIKKGIALFQSQL